MVAGGEVIATPLARRNSDTITTHSGIGGDARREQAERAETGDDDADGEGAGDAPALGGAPGEVIRRP